MKSIVLITTGQPSTNPRLVKEADALTAAGYRVTVLYCYWVAWAQQADQVLLKHKPWKWMQLGGTPDKGKIAYMITKMRCKAGNLIFRKFGITKFSAGERAFCRAYDELLREAIKQNGDFYLAHNLGALPVAFYAAKKNGAKVGFDAEDFHRGQETNTQGHSYKLSVHLEEKYLPRLDYFSAASPMIGDAYKALSATPDPLIINNVFSRKLQPEAPQQKPKATLDLFWFSQTVGQNRGIEDVIKAVGLATNRNIVIHLLGHCRLQEREYFYNVAAAQKVSPAQLNFIDPVEADALFEKAAAFDIGLALENSDSINRDICLTNKIFTYILAGNAIIFSATQAQQQFYNQYPGLGKCFTPGNIQQLAHHLNYYYSNRDALQECRSFAWHLGNTLLNWENEQVSFLKAVSHTLSPSSE